MSKRVARGTEGVAPRKGTSSTKQAELLLILADRVGASEGESAQAVIDPSSLEEMIAQGIICPERRAGEGYVLCEDPKAFRRAFAVCDDCGRSADLLRTRYAVAAIDETLLEDASKGLVLVSILSLLRLLSSGAKEASEDPSLLDLGEALGASEESSSGLDGITRSLKKAGFRALLDFGLSGVAPEERKAAKAEHLLEMAQKDVDMFFADEPPIPALGDAFMRLLFPEGERAELLAVLQASPSAIRALLLACEARSGSLATPAVVQALPLLERLFHLFAVSDPRRCDARKREALGREVTELVQRTVSAMPSPSPLLAALRGRMVMDSVQ